MRKSLLFFIILFIPFVFAEETIILSSNNYYSNSLSDTSKIYKSGKYSSLLGGNVEFSCAPCDTANFNDAVSKVGGGVRFCGYSESIPRKIVSQDIIICAKDKTTGNLYDIDFLNWVGNSGCFDNDGVSCNLYSNFAYILTDNNVEEVIPEPVVQKEPVKEVVPEPPTPIIQKETPEPPKEINDQEIIPSVPAKVHVEKNIFQRFFDWISELF